MIKSFITSIIMSIFLITILNIFLRKNSTSVKKNIGLQHYFFGYLFMLYLMISLEAVGFPTLGQWQRLLRLNEPIFNPIINLVPFNDGLEISAILNIVLFVPFGFLLPTLWKKHRNLFSTLCSGLLLSIIIELAQLFVPFRASDINDLIMNSLGTICGFFIFNIISKIFHKQADKTAVESSSNDSMLIKLEPYIYIVLAIISTFLG